jgi:dihydrofolate reductase
VYADDQFGQAMSEWIAGAGGLLLGRKTYEIFAGHWPRITDEEDPIATALTASRSTSHRERSTEWSGTIRRC